VLEGGAEGGQGAQGRRCGILCDEVGAVLREVLEGVDDGADVGLIGPGCELREGHGAGVGDVEEREAGVGEHAEELVILGAAVRSDIHGASPRGGLAGGPESRGPLPMAHPDAFDANRHGLAGVEIAAAGSVARDSGDFGICVIHSRGVRAGM
jgi:hypothetical protein